MIAQVIKNDVVMPLYIEATLQLLPPVWYVLMLEPCAHWAAERQKKSYTSIKATLPHWSIISLGPYQVTKVQLHLD